jgi:magnesium chelatase subunit H
LISADDHVKRERWLKEIEAQWGPAPGRQLSNGSSIFVLGKKFGNVLVSVQPSFGYEGDPMRLLFEKGLAPTHAFSAFYATCAKISKPMLCFTLARMVHLNSCQVNNLA